MIESIKLSKLWRIYRFEAISPGGLMVPMTSEEVYRKWTAGAEGYNPYEVSEFSGNLLLNEGILALQNLLVGSAETAFSNANSYIGVGDDNTAESASQTGLQAASNKLYKGMEATYPTVVAQTTTWRAQYTSAEGNFAWNEFTVASGNSDAADNLNRKVSAQGTKGAGTTWTIDLQITWQ